MAGLTIKQEKFCQLYIENGGNASNAYRGAYSASKMKENTINSKAYLLLKKDYMAARVKDLQSKSAKKHEITVEWMTDQYKVLLIMAVEQNKVADAKGVLDSLGKLHGLIVDKKRIDGNINHNHQTESVSESFSWIEGMLGRAETRPNAEPVLN